MARRPSLGGVVREVLPGGRAPGARLPARLPRRSGPRRARPAAATARPAPA